MTSSILALAPGIHADVPEAIYHQRELGVASKSALDLVARSPAHYYAWIQGSDRTVTPALRLGRAVHCAMLEPDRFAMEYVGEPAWGDCRNTDNKRRRDEWRAARVGLPTYTADEASSIRGMVESVLADELARPMLEHGLSEVTCRWDDRASGIACKARTDRHVREFGVIADLKSTEDASEDAFQRSIANYNYHRQAAHYLSGFRAIGADVEHFVFIAVEKTVPFAVALYELDQDAIDEGEEDNRRHIDLLAECVSRGHYPSYSKQIRTLSLPRWKARTNRLSRAA